nr:hypothetical protein [Tanacetum cinerariifolium]
MQKIIKEQVKEQVKTSYAVATDLSEIELKKILIKKMEGNKSIHRSNEQRNLYKALVKAYESDKIILDTYEDTVTLKRRQDDDADKDEKPSAGSDRGSAGKSTQGSKSLQTSASKSATAEEPMQTTHEMEEPSHLEFETGADDQPIAKPSQHPEWFSQQKKPPTPYLDTLTLELLAGLTYEQMKGLCKSLVDLEFFLEEVYKATTDQLDWVNPEALHQQRPRVSSWRCLKPQVYNFCHQDKGSKLRAYQFYGFAVNRESARDVYSKRKIIAVTEFKIVEWYNYKHLDWITVRRDDDKLYKFKEGDFKRLRIQDIEDMLLLLNKDKQNMLMRIDELYKFSDGTLTDVHTALDDRLKGIRMKYL